MERENFKIGWDRNYGPYLSICYHSKKIIFCLCHRKEERSFWFFGLEKYLCSRCIGILIGGIIGIIFYKAVDYNNFIFPFLILPMVFDGLLQSFTDYESKNLTRFITGLIFGFGFVFFGKIILSFFRM